MANSIKISPFFVNRGESARDQVEWEKRACGEPGVFFCEEAEVPRHWSQMATDIVVGKYFRRSGVPETKHETSAWQMVDRVCSTIAESGVAQGLLDCESADIFAEELAHLVLQQKASFNSPVWFNSGLSEKYGIAESGENYSWNLVNKTVTKNEDIYLAPQGSACFIQSLAGDFASVFELLKREALIFKFGSGSGTNFSNLSGNLIPVLEIFDRSAGAIRSGGVTRRAAKMVCLDVDHPEIEAFIDWKVSEERKAEALIAAGYSGGIEGEAYRSVSGQNANHSIRVSQDFMENGERSLLRKMAEAAWSCGDPGIQFSGTIQSWNPCANTVDIRASNPCSEYMFVDESACNLASVNLVHFARDGEIDWDALRSAVHTLLVAQDILVDHCGYPTREIAENSHGYRPLGLGFTNLGGLLLRLGLPYESEEARDLSRGLMSFMYGVSLKTSCAIARLVGPFSRFEENREPYLNIVRRQSDLLKSWLEESSIDVLDQAVISEAWEGLVENVEKSGVRNAQLTAIAPTGTISMMMDCDTTGIEPEFSFVKRKEMVGGGELVWVNRSVEPAFKKLGYDTDLIVKILKKVESGMEPASLTEIQSQHRSIFAAAQGASGISAEGHLQMMAAVQPFVSGAISKTINLPESSSVEDVEKVFVRAWELGLKSVAVYRNQSKAGQPLHPIRCLDCG